MRKKKFEKTLPSGLGITKSGRLQVPNVWSPDDSELNGYGQPMPKVGDKVADVAHGGRITKKNVGEIVAIKALESTGMFAYKRDYIEFKRLIDGKVEDTSWLDSVYVLNDDEYKEVIEYLGIKPE